MKKFVIVIPARLQSSRLKNKPLIKINNKEMILRTIDQCKKATNIKNIFVCTDSQKLKNFLSRNNFNNTIVTSEKCKTGTDRIYQFSKKINAKNYINVQGDEPIVNPYDIKKIIKYSLDNPDVVVKGYSKITKNRDYQNKNIPKVVISKNKFLLYMSRNNIPSNFKNIKRNLFKQICIYSFPKKILNKVFRSNTKGDLESNEDIEILRFIENDFKVKMILLSGISMSVDVKEDVREVEKIIKKNEKFF